MLKHWINRYQTIKHVELEGKDAHFFFHKNVWFQLDEGSKIIIQNGLVQIGYNFANIPPRPSYDKTVVTLRKNAVLRIGAGVHICPGAFILVGKNAEMVLGPDACIANNCTFICNKKFELGANASISWNVTLIDDDSRVFYQEDGTPVVSKRRDLIIQENVGIQMNAVIPKGVLVGKNSVIGANTIVRGDVPENSLVYQNPEMRVRYGTTTGFQNQK